MPWSILFLTYKQGRKIFFWKGNTHISYNVVKETQPSGPTGETLNKENVPAQSNDPPFSRVNTLGSGEDSLKLNELMKLCTKLSERVLNLETTKTAQAKESSDEEVIVETGVTDATTTVVFINDITLAQALMELKTSKPKERGIIMQESSETPKTTTTIPISLKFHDKGKGIMVEEPLKMKKKDQISFDEQEARRLQAEFDEQDKLVEEKAQLIEDENLAWDNVQAMIDADFVPIDSEVVKGKVVLTQEISSKRAGDKLDLERSKKQKVEDNKEQEELKRCLEIIPDDVTIDATPLSIKTPIIDYKIYKEGKKSYF
nr:hypothetical protein [Tanacetum cinerariifolium]